VALEKENNMIIVKYIKFIEGPRYSLNESHEDAFIIGEEEITFNITFKQAAKYFAPDDYKTWTKEKKDGFAEAIAQLYYMDALDQIIYEEDDFSIWAYENFYTNN
jgi:hypothetical protein